MNKNPHFYEVRVATPEQYADGVWRPMTVVANDPVEAKIIVDDILAKQKSWEVKQLQ